MQHLCVDNELAMSDGTDDGDAAHMLGLMRSGVVEGPMMLPAWNDWL